MVENHQVRGCSRVITWTGSEVGDKPPFTWRQKWQPTPIFLPGNPMVTVAWGAIVCGVAKSDRTEQLIVS